MDTWYGTVLIPEYGITILNTYGYGAFHGYFISWWLCMLYDWPMLCAVQIMVFLTLCRLNC